MVDAEKVCVLIPTYNEAATIQAVVEGFKEQGFEHILVMDGGSSDDTQQLAADAGARVEEQSGSGKGQAVREAVSLISQPVVLMADGDSTYRAEEAERMLAPIFDGEAEHVIGDRFANMQPGAMTRLNKFGNRMINRAFGFIHGERLTDILSGYRAFTTESFQRLSMSAQGFGIETEMAVECVKHDVRTVVVPITYEPRPDESETNLRPFRDGGNIILRLYQMAKTNNPLFYFGSIGVLSGFVGVLLAAYVGYAWVFNGVAHDVLALAGGVALLFGLQLVMFGVLSDLIVTSNQRQQNRLRRISEQLDELEETGVTTVSESQLDTAERVDAAEASEATPPEQNQ